MKIRALLFTLLSGILLTVAPKAMAQSCTTQYGGATTCVTTNLTVNKQVENPKTHAFVENLSSDTPFSVGSDVLFRLIITNNGSQNLSTVTVKDIFPKELTFAGGPGTFDAASNTLTFTVDNLAAGASQTVQVLATVDGAKVSRDRSVFCIVNTAKVQSDTQSDQDTAQVCIQTNVLGATTLPVAGFNDFAFLLPFAGLGLIGTMFLIKRG